jgi:uncharacterized RDD family membrane protein YckC
VNSTNPYAPPRAEVHDPEVEQAALAGRGTRLLAAILDGIIFLIMVYGPAVLGFVVAGGPASIDVDPDAEATATLFAVIGGVIGLIPFLLLNLLFVVRNGQSIGKKIIGIKVVRTDGSRASLARIFWLRNVVNTLLGIIPLYGLIDILLIFGDQRQCIHDKLADTIVIGA